MYMTYPADISDPSAFMHYMHTPRGAGLAERGRLAAPLREGQGKETRPAARARVPSPGDRSPNPIPTALVWDAAPASGIPMLFTPGLPDAADRPGAEALVQ